MFNRSITKFLKNLNKKQKFSNFKNQLEVVNIISKIKKEL